VPEPSGQLDPDRVVRQRLLAGDGVLMYSDVLGAMQRYRAQCHGAVSVSHNDDAAGRRSLDGRASRGKDEPIGGVDSHEIVGLEVGKPTQNLEVKGIAH
jgi:hypothetical protein